MQPGGGRYSKIIRGLREAIVTIETVTSRALQEKDAEIARLTHLLEVSGTATNTPAVPQVPERMSDESTSNK